MPSTGRLFLCFTTIAAALEFRDIEANRMEIRMEADPCARSPPTLDGDIGEPARGQCESVLDTFWLAVPSGTYEIEGAEYYAPPTQPRSSSSSSPEGVFGKPEL